MFSDLTELEEGDLFFIHVLNYVLAYRVCEIQVILPEDTGSLVAENGRDLVSLLTCTPYGVNKKALLISAVSILAVSVSVKGYHVARRKRKSR